jgi:S1-C subfamily serine protease
MTATTQLRAVTAILLLALGVLGSAGAQEPAAPPPSPEAGISTSGTSALDEAKARLEAAARDVARLSAEATAPVVRMVTRGLRGEGRRAMLGVTIEDAQDGVSVIGVSPGGPADQAGLKAGDVILSINGTVLSGADETPSRRLMSVMARVEPGDSVGLRVRSGGEDRDVVVEARPLEDRMYFVGRRFGPPGGGPVTVSGPPRGRPGAAGWPPPFFPGPLGRWRDMELVDLTPALGGYFGTEEGILVVRAPRDEKLQLQDGDVILEIGGRKPMTPEHAMRILASFEPGETLTLTIMRQKRRQTLSMEVPPEPHRG